MNINEEVLDWDQPIFEVKDIGIIFSYSFYKWILLFSCTKKEFGLIDSFELGPTIMALSI